MVTDKPWGGRFDGQTDAFVEHFSASVDEDKRLARYDIRGSIAHARMLARTGILTDAEGEAIVTGLTAIGNTIVAGDFEWSPALEDVHMNIEAALVARIGDVGKKLHTARSRNDQVATAMRLYVRDAIDAVHTRLVQLVEALLVRAEAEAATVMPGFTHLQTAQPVTFGHHLLAWAEMAMRDIDRFHDARRRTNVSPLGAAALAGSSFAIDRADTAAALDFAVVAANSLDAVSDRDFAIDCVYACAMTMQHLSRWCEELVLWASPLVGMVILPDALCTGSSIMPQKKNPDVAELIRGKTGRVYGHLTALLTLMKAQPLAYNRDNQEDKRPVFDAIDTTLDSLHGITLLIAQLQPQRERMLALAGDGFSTATDLADYLVRCGVPFRDAHAQVGRIVRIAAERHVALHEVSLAEMRAVAPAVADDVFAVLSVEGSVAARAHSGGTAPLAVRQAVQRLRERLTTAAT